MARRLSVLVGACAVALWGVHAAAQKAEAPTPPGPPEKIGAPELIVDGASSFEPTVDPQPRPEEDPDAALAEDRTGAAPEEVATANEESSSEPTVDPQPRPEEDPEAALAEDRTGAAPEEVATATEESSFEPTVDPQPRPEETPDALAAEDRTRPLSAQDAAALDDGLATPETPPSRGAALAPDCAACPEMVVIEGGALILGAPAGDAEAELDERPRAAVDLAPFALATTETTIGAFRAFVDATGYDARGACMSVDANGDWEERDSVDWSAPGFEASDAHPVVCVSYEDAQAYVAWLNDQDGVEGAPYRLPSEAEFEFAARAGVYDPYAWGDDPNASCETSNAADLTALARYDFWTVSDCDDGHMFAAPVGSFPENRLGLFDIVGNVWEWTADCPAGSHEGAPADGSARTDGDCFNAVLRGGAWVESPTYMRLAERFSVSRDTRAHWAGFRVARDLAPEAPDADLQGE